MKSWAPAHTPPAKLGAYAKKLEKSPLTGVPVVPSTTRASGPPPGPGPVTMSALPSRVTSPAATWTPSVKPGL